MKKSLPQIEELRQVIRYDPETGHLFWLHRKDVRKHWNDRFAGGLALNAHNEGYRSGTINGISCKAHRAAWALYYGEWPHGAIDHINGIKSDNRILNLRVVDCCENNKNKPIPKNNKSGFIGVHRSGRKWTASIRANKRQIYLGSFDNISLAVAARQAAEQSYGFNYNHGRKA